MVHHRLDPNRLRYWTAFHHGESTTFVEHEWWAANVGVTVLHPGKEDERHKFDHARLPEGMFIDTMNRIRKRCHNARFSLATHPRYNLEPEHAAGYKPFRAMLRERRNG